MKDKEKLIDILLQRESYYPQHGDLRPALAEKDSEYLISCGVVVLPCKVGETVYEVKRDYCDRRELDKCDGCCDGWDCSCPDNNAEWLITPQFFSCGMLDRIGNTVFLTYEEAKEEIRRRKSKS